MNNRTTTLSLARKAWPLLRKGDISGLWRAARHRAAVAKWYKDNGENVLRLDYPLTPDSVIFDIGGYRGLFTREIVARYDSNIYVFEPLPEFCEHIAEQFPHKPNVRICNYGLSDADAMSKMTVADEGSSIYTRGNKQATIRLRDIDAVVRELGIGCIDLVKVNIEGGEYVLLRRMLETGLVSICRDIQVQFHHFYPRSRRLRSEIREALRRTHFLTYDYPFVWENWRKRTESLALMGPAGKVVARSVPDHEVTRN